MKKYTPPLIILGYLLVATATSATYNRNCRGLEHLAELDCVCEGALAGALWWMYVPYKVWSRVLP